MVASAGGGAQWVFLPSLVYCKWNQWAFSELHHWEAGKPFPAWCDVVFTAKGLRQESRRGYQIHQMDFKHMCKLNPCLQQPFPLPTQQIGSEQGFWLLLIFLCFCQSRQSLHTPGYLSFQLRLFNICRCVAFSFFPPLFCSTRCSQINPTLMH